MTGDGREHSPYAENGREESSGQSEVGIGGAAEPSQEQARRIRSRVCKDVSEGDYKKKHTQVPWSASVLTAWTKDKPDPIAFAACVPCRPLRLEALVDGKLKAGRMFSTDANDRHCAASG